jgi:hypothetical protein
VVSKILGHNRRPAVPGVLDPDKAQTEVDDAASQEAVATTDVSYVAPQEHRIFNVALHQESNDFTSQSKVVQISTYHTSPKASLKRDKITYTSGEQELLIELSSFNMCTTLQSL